MIPINLFLGVALSMVANILLGSINSIINKKFNTVKLAKGFIKSIIVLASLILLMVAGLLNPDIKVVDDMTIPMAIEIVSIAAFIFYSAQGLLKIKEIALPDKKEK